jgi:hypothetical protein
MVRVAAEDEGVRLAVEELGDAITLADAEGQLGPVEQGLADGRRAFFDGDHAVAITYLAPALERYDRAPAYYFSSLSAAEGWLVLAQAYDRAGQRARAQAAYLTVARRWPELDVDPHAFPPGVTDNLRRARRQAKEGRGGPVRISSRPPEADVYVDGRPVGKTPVSLESLASGRHHLRVEVPGMAVRTLTLDVAPRRPEDVDVDLRGPAGEAAERLVDALAVGKGETTVRRLALGVGEAAGSSSVWVGVVVDTPEGGTALVVCRMDAPDGALRRVVRVELGERSETTRDLRAAVRNLAGATGVGEGRVESGRVTAEDGVKALVFPTAAPAPARAAPEVTRRPPPEPARRPPPEPPARRAEPAPAPPRSRPRAEAPPRRREEPPPPRPRPRLDDDTASPRPEAPLPVTRGPREEDQAFSLPFDPRILGLVTLGLVVAGMTLASVVASLALAGGAGVFLWLNPPNPRGTDVSVDGSRLRE